MLLSQLSQHSQRLQRSSRIPRNALSRVSVVAAVLSACVGVGLMSAQALQAQSYPNKSVRVVVPFPPGGATDVVGRLLSTTKGCPSCSCSLVASSRPTTSVAPPGGNGTTTRTDLLG